jgi:hypothetical protein
MKVTVYKNIALLLCLSGHCSSLHAINKKVYKKVLHRAFIGVKNALPLIVISTIYTMFASPKPSDEMLNMVNEINTRLSFQIENDEIQKAVKIADKILRFITPVILSIISGIVMGATIEDLIKFELEEKAIDEKSDEPRSC